ncbi:hypothetical protein RND81_11G121000 [Saponaria officinalis]|uniref:Uncharacterized protein n=1 Tax=Saponaria officinalis TaxID=3572 RepID=A0AAW1HKW6_SAPOF
METNESNVEERMLNQNHQVDDEEDQRPPKSKKGGFISIPFILANEAFEKVASFGLTPNMIVYLMNDYKMSVTNAQNLIYFWNTASNFTPFVGAILADSLLGRFLTIGFGSIFSLLGMFVLWLTTIIPQVKPPPCDPSTSTCSSPTTGQYAFLIFAFVLMAIGGGGTKPCSQAFGADQVHRGDNPKNKNNLEIFLNWYYMFSCLSIIVAMTVIVYIQDHLGWMVGFGVPVVLMFLATLFFFLAAPIYVMVDVNRNLLVGLMQVIVAGFRNRKLSASDCGSDAQYFQGTDSSVSIPSEKLRFLNAACTIRDPDSDIGPDGLPRDPWRLCRVEDVEGLKSFIRVIPIWSTGIMICVNTSISSFSVLLTRTMDRHVGSNFEIPAASFGTFIIVVIGIWIPLYYRVILPLASKIKGKPVTISVKARMGIGLFCSFMSILTSGMVESIRRQRAIDQGFEDDPKAVIQMSALWTLPHSIFGGIAEAFFVIGQTEFFFSELPKNMLSVAGAIFGLSGTIGNLMASLLLNFINGVTKTEGEDGWIADNVNKGHYDYYYYLLAGLNVVNVIFYVYCSSIYGPTKNEIVVKEVIDDDDDDNQTSPLLRDTAHTGS